MKSQSIWYGAKDNNVRFAHSPEALKDQGITDPQEFQVGDNGSVTGLSILGNNEPEQQVTGSQQPTA